jgi:2,3-bisphosphoglycerate-independent phosphoglycerate mutase
MGAGLAMAPGDVAFKCNLASLAREGGGGGEKGGDPATTAAPDPAAHPTPVVAARRAGRDFEVDGPALCAALDGVVMEGHPGVAVRVRHATEPRAGVVLSAAGGLSDADALEEQYALQQAAASASARAPSLQQETQRKPLD